MTLEQSGFDLFAKRIDAKGNVTFEMHRVWDKMRFLSARLDDAVAENEKENSTKAAFIQITEAEYLKNRKAK